MYRTLVHSKCLSEKELGWLSHGDANIECWIYSLCLWDVCFYLKLPAGWLLVHCILPCYLFRFLLTVTMLNGNTNDKSNDLMHIFQWIVMNSISWCTFWIRLTRMWIPIELESYGKMGFHVEKWTNSELEMFCFRIIQNPLTKLSWK